MAPPNRRRTVLVDAATLASAPQPLVCSNFCRRVVVAQEFEPAFVQFALRLKYAAGDLDRYQNQSTNLRNLQFNEFLDGVAVRKPALPDQKRIVAKIEELLTHVNAARDRLACVPAILKRFRQSVLAAACSGELTKDFRELQEERETGEVLL